MIFVNQRSMKTPPPPAPARPASDFFSSRLSSPHPSCHPGQLSLEFILSSINSNLLPGRPPPAFLRLFFHFNCENLGPVPPSGELSQRICNGVNPSVNPKTYFPPPLFSDPPPQHGHQGPSFLVNENHFQQGPVNVGSLTSLPLFFRRL